MLPDIQVIARRRKQLDLKQKDLAKISRVSQSFIAKLESGKINPSYQKVKSILEAFERLEHENSVKARDIMNRRVIFVRKSDSITEAVGKMKKNSISQLPVFNGDSVIGTISESAIVSQMEAEKSIKDIMRMPITEILEEPYPQISETTPISAIAALLHHSQAVLVTKKGKPIGIITKSDMLKM